MGSWNTKIFGKNWRSDVCSWACKEEAKRLMIEEDQQYKRENGHAYDLSGNSDIVDNRHQPYTRNINDRTD